MDVRLLVELIRKHADKLEVWVAVCPHQRALRQWVESRRMIVGEKVRLTNRMLGRLRFHITLQDHAMTAHMGSI